MVIRPRRPRRPPPPPPRPGHRDTLRRVRRMTDEEDERERPFDPEAPRESYARAHHFSVNGLTPVSSRTVTVEGTTHPRPQFTLLKGARGVAIDEGMASLGAADYRGGRWVRGRGSYDRRLEPYLEILQREAPGGPRDIQAALRGHHLPNTHHTLQGGLHDDEETLTQLVEMAAESAEIENYQDASVTEEVVDVARDFDFAVASALDSLVTEYPPQNGGSADDLWYANGPFLILMTLRGEGVGIWDGTWDDFYDSRTIKSRVQPFLESKLGEYADIGGSGRFEEALMNAAYETTGGYEGNARGGTFDRHAAEELELYIDNDRQFSPASPEGMGRAIARNLHRKLKRGTYDPEKAVKGWLNLVDAAAKEYVREFHSSMPWHEMFTVPTRRHVATEMARQFEREHAAGEHEHLD